MKLSLPFAPVLYLCAFLRGLHGIEHPVGNVSRGRISNTYCWIDPEKELIGILMTQIFPFGHLHTRAEYNRLVDESISENAGKAEKR